jgi:ubiquinone/menaquinone biosynthesis C-methylase UbiE
MDAEIVRTTDLGLGCGVPTGLADLKPGMTVLDLGSGGGIDVFLAAKTVGPAGKAIGVDMTPAMIQLATDNAAKLGMTNVEFRLGDIEDLPVEDTTVDVILSNCVINLADDKSRVFQGMFRVLRSGGSFTVSDIVALDDVPPSLRADLKLWAACVSGAMHQDDYLEGLRTAGFHDVKVLASTEYPVPEQIAVRFASITVTGTKP